MLPFLIENGGTILIVLALIAIVLLIVWKLGADKRKGKNSCGCGCKNCPSSGMCHSHKN